MLVYLVAFAALIMMGVMLTSSTSTSKKIEYYKLLETIQKDIDQGDRSGSGIEIISIRRSSNTVVGKYESPLTTVSDKESPTRYIYGDEFKKIVSTPRGNIHEIEIDGRKYLLYNESAIIPKDGCSCCSGK